MILFVRRCDKARPGLLGMLVQEDGAPCHAHYAQAVVYSHADVEQIVWCGNSPDLNAIEPCWAWMKWDTTKKGPLELNMVVKKLWIRY